MEVLQTRILASASRNYNKAEVEMVITNASAEDMEYVEKLLVHEAIKTLDYVCEENNDSSNSAPVVQTQRAPMGNAQGNAPRAPREGSYNRGYAPKNSGVSDKQRNILLKNGFSNDQINSMDSKSAASAIQGIWARSGYQPKNQQRQSAPQQNYSNYNDNYNNYTEYSDHSYGDEEY